MVITAAPSRLSRPSGSLICEDGSGFANVLSNPSVIALEQAAQFVPTADRANKTVLLGELQLKRA